VLGTVSRAGAKRAGRGVIGKHERWASNRGRVKLSVYWSVIPGFPPLPPDMHALGGGNSHIKGTGMLVGKLE